MQDWVVITLAAFVYTLVMFAFSRVFRLDERHRAMREFTARLQKNPDSVTEEEVMHHTKEMYKVMGLRLAMVFIVFYPLYYAFSSRYGEVLTPLGVSMHWIWWFLISSVVAQVLVGGVKRWLARSRGG